MNRLSILATDYLMNKITTRDLNEKIFLEDYAVDELLTWDISRDAFVTLLMKIKMHIEVEESA